ncbi:hypothetical protein [Micromonospora fulviviridis]|uniref:hypothetical protein n=1 Tax=Micromonospora fulviviridis TaxID=47860 RepID=UPI00379B9A91
MTSGNGWRWWLSVAGAGLGSLPLWQGRPLLAVVAAICGLTIVGSWAWGTRAGRATGVTLGSGWIAALITTVAVSVLASGALLTASAHSRDQGAGSPVAERPDLSMSEDVVPPARRETHCE